MTWIDNESWWEAGFHPGRTLYWLATIIAAFMVVLVIADFFINWAQGAPIVRIVALTAAAAVWLIGRACRALLT